MDEERNGPAVAARLYVLAVLVMMWWLLIPEHSRKLWAMKALDLTRRGTATLAFRAGRVAVAQEARYGARAYLLPYWLSRARDAAGAAYERARAVS